MTATYATHGRPAGTAAHLAAHPARLSNHRPGSGATRPHSLANADAGAEHDRGDAPAVEPVPGTDTVPLFVVRRLGLHDSEPAALWADLPPAHPSLAAATAAATAHCRTADFPDARLRVYPAADGSGAFVESVVPGWLGPRAIFKIERTHRPT